MASFIGSPSSAMCMWSVTMNTELPVKQKCSLNRLLCSMVLARTHPQKKPMNNCGAGCISALVQYHQGDFRKTITSQQVGLRLACSGNWPFQPNRVGRQSMEMKFRTTSGAIVNANPLADSPAP